MKQLKKATVPLGNLLTQFSSSKDDADAPTSQNTAPKN